MIIVGVVTLAGCTQYVGPPSASGTASLPARGGQVHRVARGETLWSIARWYGVELKDLAEANGISNSSRIEVGQRLAIPARSASSAAPAQPRPSRPSSSFSAGNHSFVWPVQGKVISAFGMRQGGRVNKGIDIQAPQGTDVVASRPGEVSFVHEALPGFGKTIIVNHGDGYATVYAYVGQILVRPGEQVGPRQVIARVGKTGRTSVPALHFEVRRNQKAQNPFHYLP